MSSVASAVRTLKSRCPESPTLSPHVCRTCRGSGRLGDFAPCETCDSTGRVLFVEREQPAVYDATSGSDLIDQGLHLESFVKGLAADWSPHESEDLAVWMRKGDRGPWLVAVIRMGGSGEPVVTYL